MACSEEALSLRGHFAGVSREAECYHEYAEQLEVDYDTN